MRLKTNCAVTVSGITSLQICKCLPNNLVFTIVYFKSSCHHAQGLSHISYNLAFKLKIVAEAGAVENNS